MVGGWGAVVCSDVCSVQERHCLVLTLKMRFQPFGLWGAAADEFVRRVAVVYVFDNGLLCLAFAHEAKVFCGIPLWRTLPCQLWGGPASGF